MDARDDKVSTLFDLRRLAMAWVAPSGDEDIVLAASVSAAVSAAAAVEMAIPAEGTTEKIQK